MDALTKIRQRNRLHAQLKSGLSVAYHLPDAARTFAELSAIDASEIWKVWEMKQRIVAEMLDAVESEELTPRDDRRAIVAALTPEERTELYALAAPVPTEEPAEETVEEGWARAGAETQKAWLEGARDDLAGAGSQAPDGRTR